LRRPESYPERPRRVEVVETHFAWVFLTKNQAYKLKKPVLQDCMDYRTIDARERGCRNELRLNRRLAASVYLGVVPITRTPDGMMLGRHGEAPIVDWLVRMRRLPARRMLDRAISERVVRASDLERLGLKLTRFFDQAPERPMSATRYVARLRERTRQNGRDLRAPDLPLNKDRVEKLTALQLAFLGKHAELLGARATLLIDGHGDLRPEHLYLGSNTDEPCVIDCLEFNADLRWLDPAEEMAFLTLECCRLQANTVARVILSRYRQSTRNPPSDALMSFYMSQRATTRAKLAAWHVRDPRFARRAALWTSRAESYLADAARYIRRAERLSSRSPRANAPVEELSAFPSTCGAPPARTAAQSIAQSTSARPPAAMGQSGIPRCR
jgi:aminoglycoside phosphotransferase family enzyme